MLARYRALTRAITLSASTLAAGLTLTAVAFAAGPRTVSFRVPGSCSCFECNVQAHRSIERVPGVRKASLSARDHRLDITLDDSGRTVSDLAEAVAKLDFGKGCTMLWSVPRSGDLDHAATALARVPGIRSAVADARSHTVQLAFTGRPTVTLAQLDTAGGAPAGGRTGNG